jgi:hypothetical protein
MKRPVCLIKGGGVTQVLKEIFAGLPNGRRECFKSMNICNQPKFLQDTIVLYLAL